jgi:hypothetical protein
MPRYSSIDAQIVLNEFYETLFKIYNHYSGDNRRPLASVALHPEEDIIKNSLLEESIKTFYLRNIKETFGISYLEYIELPRYIGEIMSDVGKELLKKKSNIADDVQKELDGLGNPVT